MLNSKTRFIWEKTKHTIISEMYWSNILRKAGSDYYVNDFLVPFVGFRLKKFTQEISIIFIIIYLFKVDLIYNNFVYNKYNKK